MGLMICYESMFSVIPRNAARNGATLLSVITNDSWFDHNTAKNLHLAHGVYRAVETGRPLIQSGINGRTAAVSSDGIITHILGSSSGEILNAPISLETRNTPYIIWGDCWVIIATIFLGVLILLKTKLKKAP